MSAFYFKSLGKHVGVGRNKITAVILCVFKIKSANESYPHSHTKSIVFVFALHDTKCSAQHVMRVTTRDVQGRLLQKVT